jgi:hypothetical protein
LIDCDARYSTIPTSSLPPSAFPTPGLSTLALPAYANTSDANIKPDVNLLSSAASIDFYKYQVAFREMLHSSASLTRREADQFFTITDWNTHKQQNKGIPLETRFWRFVVDEAGRPIDAAQQSEVCRAFNKVFRRLTLLNMAPATWGAASDAAEAYLMVEIAGLYPYLARSAGLWKIRAIATKIYPDFVRPVKGKNPRSTSQPPSQPLKKIKLDDTLLPLWAIKHGFTPLTPSSRSTSASDLYGGTDLHGPDGSQHGSNANMLEEDSPLVGMADLGPIGPASAGGAVVIDDEVTEVGVAEVIAVGVGAIRTGPVKTAAVELGAVEAGAVKVGKHKFGAIELAAVDKDAVDMAAGNPDAGHPDTGHPNTGSPDAGDACPRDAGAFEAGAVDAGTVDEGASASDASVSSVDAAEPNTIIPHAVETQAIDVRNEGAPGVGRVTKADVIGADSANAGAAYVDNVDAAEAGVALAGDVDAVKACTIGAVAADVGNAGVSNAVIDRRTRPHPLYVRLAALIKVTNSAYQQ